MKNKVSPEVEVQAMKIAKGTQKIGQTKEQTKLVAQGIEHGIAEYKKQQGKKLREIDKQRKQKVKHRNNETNETNEIVEVPHTTTSIRSFPWILLVLSWLGFIAYFAL
jgi:hypothetical protein